MKKRICSLLLALLMVVTMLPTTASAAETASGTCGENLTWTLDDTGTLTISGTGEMEDNYYSPWESQKKSIKHVVIENGVTSIGEFAFDDCTGLMSVAMPNSVTSIRTRAFSGCTGLTSVTIPDSVTVLGSSAFSCTGLMSVVIPNSVTSIEGWTFSDCTGLMSVTIPSSVTSIGDSTFSGCIGLTSVTIPNSVTSIGEYAFSGCTGLASITIPDSVRKIENKTFSDCTGLISVTIPDSVTDIEFCAFENCTSLANVFIPAGVTTNNVYAFDGCTALTEFTVAEENASYAADEGVLFNKDMTRIIRCPEGKSGSYTIPNSVTAVGGGAFSDCTGLTNVLIPSSVTSIGASAFSDCTGLTNIAIPNSVTNIGGSAFSGCTGLTNIAIPSSVTGIKSYIFYDCTSLDSVTIPTSVTAIGYNAFFNCSKLKDVYYKGTDTQWSTIEISEGNYTLKNATIHFQQSLPQPPAGPGGTITVVPAYQAQPGETVTVKLNLSANKGISNMRLQLTYPEGFTLEKVQKGNALSALNFTPPGILTANPVNFVWDGTAADTSEGCILELTFRVANTVAEGGHNISLSYQEGDVLDGDMNEIQLELNQGEVQVWCQHLVKAARYAQAATCTTAGNSEYYICCACGKYFSDVHGENEIAEDSWVIEALGHDIVTDEAVSATCTGAGLTEGSHCSRCGTVLKAQAEISALGHDYKNGTCTRCGAKNPNNKPAAPAVKPDYLLSTGKPYLKWKAVDGAVKYYVYRSGSKSGTYKYIGTATKLNYTDTTAKPGYYYYYNVKAVNAGGVGSNASAAVTALCHCARPKLNGAQYQASTGKPYLSWGTVTGAGKYYVYRAGSQNGAYKYIGSTTKTNYTDTTASAGYTYYYKVEAVSKVRSAANSANSKALAVNSHCARPVVKPDYLASTGKPYLKWSAVTGASKYEVYRAGSQNGTYKYIGSTTKTGYTDTNASAGYAYYYKVKAISNVKSTANSSYSTVVKATCHCAKPVVKITTSSGKPKLTWNAVAGASKYEVYRSTSKNGTYTKMFTTTNRSYTNTNARPGTTYYYKVKAISRVRSTANSSYSVVKSIRAR